MFFLPKYSEKVLKTGCAKGYIKLSLATNHAHYVEGCVVWWIETFPNRISQQCWKETYKSGHENVWNVANWKGTAWKCMAMARVVDLEELLYSTPLIRWPKWCEGDVISSRHILGAQQKLESIVVSRSKERVRTKSMLESVSTHFGSISLGTDLSSSISGNRFSLILGLLVEARDRAIAIFKFVVYLLVDWSHHGFIISKTSLAVCWQGQIHKLRYNNKEIFLLAGPLVPKILECARISLQTQHSKTWLPASRILLFRTSKTFLANKSAEWCSANQGQCFQDRRLLPNVNQSTIGSFAVFADIHWGSKYSSNNAHFSAISSIVSHSLLSCIWLQDPRWNGST